MKTYWNGEDIEQLPREKLIEIIRALGQQLERHRTATKAYIDTSNMIRAARAHQ